MTVTAERPTLAATPTTPSLASRVYGFGSVFGKTLRDSRRAMLLVGGFLSVIWLTTGSTMATAFGTVASRQEVVQLTETLPPLFLGLYGGDAINVDTLGGFANWRFGVVLFVFTAFWSILALSGTLVVEARRGSMEFLAASRSSRVQIALQKLAAHVVALTIVMAVIALVAFVVGQVFATLPGDTIPLEAAFAYTLVIGLSALVAGAIAFALAPLVGRGGAAGIAAFVMLGSWLVNGFRDSIPVFETLSSVSYFAWTAGHRPIAGTYDWLSLVPLVVVVVAGFAIGIATFARRDLGDVGSVRTPGLPAGLLGLHGPLGRTFGERLPGALGWGLGIGVYSLVIGASAESLRETIADGGAIEQMFAALFPQLDLQAPGVTLQLMFISFGMLAVGLAAAALVNGWASDEADGRLEMLLATPQDRFLWAIRSGLGAFAAIVALTAVVALAVGIGVTSAGDAALEPMAGTVALLFFGLAVAGVGLAVGGLVRVSLAAAASALVVLATFLVDLLVPALDLPPEFRNLALTAHFGEPMVGSWNAVGIVASLAIAFGGLALGAWGFARRDLER